MTAVEWLWEQIPYEFTSNRSAFEVFEQAKEMEKQQIMNTYIIADSESTQEDSEHNALKFYERTYGSKGSDELSRNEKLEILAKLLAKTWFYGDWNWETPNERIMQMLMVELGYYPFASEDEMIQKTGVHDDLYKKAVDKVRVGKPRQPLYYDDTSSQTEISDEEIEKAAAHHEPMVTRRAWVSACKWYREQLKQK